MCVFHDFFFKQKTADELRISDWSSDVCSSDLTMVGAVRTDVEQERTAGSDGTPQGADAQALQGTLAELMGCGSGYLAGRCDAACVARTMTQMVREFAPR